MSMHEQNDGPSLEEALVAHGLSTDTPSQLADAFRCGWAAYTDPDALDRMEWKPIADIPDGFKDGRDLLLYQDGWAISPVIVGRLQGECWLSDTWDIHDDDQRPTHYMPLPKEPSE